MLFSFFKALEKTAMGVSGFTSPASKLNSTSSITKPLKPIMNTMKSPLTPKTVNQTSLGDNSFPFSKPNIKGGIRSNPVPIPSVAPTNPLK